MWGLVWPFIHLLCDRPLSLWPANALVKQSAEKIDHRMWQTQGVRMCCWGGTWVEEKKVRGFFWERQSKRKGERGMRWERQAEERQRACERKGERKRGGIGWQWMLVSGDVGGPLILASSCLVIVYFFWPEIDCSMRRWICPWTFFSLSYIFFFLCSAKVIMLSVRLSLLVALLFLFTTPSLVFSPLIYFRLQSLYIAGCWKCVHVAKTKWRSGIWMSLLEGWSTWMDTDPAGPKH